MSVEVAWRERLATTLARVDQEGVVLVSDLDAVPGGESLRLRPDARSAAAIPLRAGHLLGVLVLNSRLRSNFRPDQEPMLAAFGVQAAAVLESALRLEVHHELLARLLLARDVPVEALRAAAAREIDSAQHATAQALRAAVREFSRVETVRLRAHLPSDLEEP
jgi:GAF domain-containing protein